MWITRERRRSAVALATGWLLMVCAAPARAQTITLATSGGLTIGGSNPSWSTGFGAVNGLGLGTPATGVTVLAATNGVLYTTPYGIVVSGASNGSKARVSAYVSTNFTPSAILSVYSCTASCSTAANYTAVSTSSATPTDIIPSPGVSSNGTVTAWLGLFVSNQNGGSAYTGNASATVTLQTFKGSTLKDTDTVALNNPLEQVQTALSLALATASGGRTVSTASDFALDYGSVNGLGIAPGTGLTVTSASGGVVYSTPYQLQPNFAGFSSTNGTLQAYVKTDFFYPAQFQLFDSANNSTFTALSKVSGTPTVLTSSAASASTVTRYLGLFVSNSNGPTIFTGSDNATVTFTLVVP
jgi:hypothetical protein